MGRVYLLLIFGFLGVALPRPSFAENPCIEGYVRMSSQKAMDFQVRFPRFFLGSRLSRATARLENQLAASGVRWDRTPPDRWLPLIADPRINPRVPARIPEMPPYRLYGFSRRNRAAPSAELPFYQHPDFPAALAEAREEGVRVYIDPSVLITRDRTPLSYYRPGVNYIVLSPQHRLDAFFHELEHHRFYRNVFSLFLESPEGRAALALAEQLPDTATRTMLDEIIDPAFERFLSNPRNITEQMRQSNPVVRRVMELFESGIRGAQVIDETLATERQARFYLGRGFREVDASYLRSIVLYRISHQLNYLQNLPNEPSALQARLISNLLQEENSLLAGSRVRLFIRRGVLVLVGGGAAVTLGLNVWERSQR